MWSFAVALYLTLIVKTYSQNSCDILLPVAQIYCISPTEFTIEPPISCNVTKFSCPYRTFCTDTPSVCSFEVPPACRLSRACNTCPPNAISTCVGAKQYSQCVDGKKDRIVKNCRASAPFCSMEYNSDGNIDVVCTSQEKDIACRDLCPTEPPPTEPPVTLPPPPAKECCGRGGFKVSVDIIGKSEKCGCERCCGCDEEADLDINVSLRVKKGI